VSPSKKHFQNEDFYSTITAENPQLHPIDDWAVYVKVSPENKGRKYYKNLCCINLKTKEEIELTNKRLDGEDSSPQWSPDGQHLSFISTRSGKPQVYNQRKFWGDSVQFSKALNGVQLYEWAPDSRSIAFLARVREEERKEEDLSKTRKKNLDRREEKRRQEDREHEEKVRVDPRVYYRTVIRKGTVFKDDRTSHIYVQILGDSLPKRITDGNHDFGSMCWDKNSELIISSTNKKANDPDIDIRSDLVKIDVKSHKMDFLTNDDHGNFYPKVCPSGDWIYYFSFQNSEHHKQRMKIRRIPINGGVPQDVIPNYDFDPLYFELDKKGEYLYYLLSYQGRNIIARVAVEGGFPESIVHFDGLVNSFHVVKDQLLYVAEAPDMPSELFLVDLKKLNSSSVKPVKSSKSIVNTSAFEKLSDSLLNTLKPKPMTKLNKRLIQKRKISLPYEIWIDRPDGYKIQGWYMLPHNYESGKSHPWVVQIHGGPHVMWGYAFWHEFQAMCARGYGVYFSNPRGSEGYGSEFKGAIHLKWGEYDSGDILAGIEKMVEMGLADSEKLFVTGGSFGGFMTAWLVTHDHRFKAAVAQRGVYNFISMYGVSDALTLIEWEFDTLPWKNMELLWDRSPLKYVENVQTPTMVLHSEQDYRVGISQAEEFYTALKREGKKTCLVRYPREGHELSRSGEPKHRVDRVNRIISWFDEHMPR
jgi:dipeptidyl aminopeptidase/acylaminoacyl peptidase